MGLRTRQSRQSSVITGAVSGASAGAVAGPYGALAGGIIGAGLGIYQANEQDKAAKKAQRTRQIRIEQAIDTEMGLKKQLTSMSSRSIEAGSQGGSMATSQSNGFIGQNISNVPSSAGTF